MLQISLKAYPSLILSSSSQLIGGVFVPAMVSWIKHVNYQLIFAVAMREYPTSRPSGALD